MDNEVIGIPFQNTVKDTKDFNIFNYRNFYNGGGVAVGDVNNDGLPDVFFTANQGSNKLYINKGNWQFEDITDKAGVADAEKWSTGVVMVDINHDGLLDIYVCNAGYQKNIGQENALYVNNGDLTFTNKAAEYGLDEAGYTTHAAFFDYDLDGDLDVYLLNNSFIPVNTLNSSNDRDKRAEDWEVAEFLRGGGDKLLRNDNDKFVNVSEEAGIYGSLIGFGLGVTVGDVNNDLFPDIYVSNDFFEKDYLYINKQDGTFAEQLEAKMPHISLSSMGADMADINNDGYPEIFVTDMLPRSEKRLKTTTVYESHYVQELKQKKGLYNQFMQNTLQLNNQDGTFSDIAYYSGVAASDWSWGALMFDADNDAKTDILVCNGIFHDVIDQDFIDFFADEVNQKMVNSGKKEQFESILKNIPSVPVQNLFFKNEGNLKFSDKSTDFGFDELSFSNGATYADLDNDGDLDVIINNVNQPAFIYQNKTNEQLPENHYLKFNLKGDLANTKSVGAKVEVFVDNQVFSKYLMPSRGFQSSTEYPLTFGLGKNKTVDSVRITWPNRTVTQTGRLTTDSTYKFSINDANGSFVEFQRSISEKYVTEVASETFISHVENDYVDFYNEKNIPSMISREGPKAAVGDVNGDGLEDVYICGAKMQAGQLYFQQQDGNFIESKQAVFGQFLYFEDTDATFFDADNDGDLDLYVGSGGNENQLNARELTDRLYQNDGNGNFSPNSKNLPVVVGQNTAVVLPIDFDGDGDLDLFVGSRSVPMQYGITPTSYVFQNDGRGKFSDVSASVGKVLQNVGLVRDAAWSDLNGDKLNELVVVGDWMNPKIFTFKNGKFTENKSNLSDYSGFWGSVELVDLNGDKQLDIVLGNIGENFSLTVNNAQPLKLWLGDFDGNQTADKVMSKTIDGKDVPVFLKRDMAEQFPFLKSQNLKHADYATKTIQQLFDADKLRDATVKSINCVQSMVAYNSGSFTFEMKPLPAEMQFSCVNAIASTDVNADGKPDLLIAGNSYTMLPQFGRLDACRGNILLNTGNGFEVIGASQSGFSISGEAKQITKLTIDGKPHFLVLINNRTPKIFSWGNISM